MKRTLAIYVLILLSTTAVFGQAPYFLGEYSLPDVDFNHYSIEQSIDGGYVIFGTIFHQVTNEKSMHLIKTDHEGTMAWEKVFSTGEDDKGLDVAIGPNAEIIITGYSEGPAGNTDNMPRLYVGLLDSWGNWINQQRIAVKDDDTYSAGTKVMYDASSDSYIIGGVLQLSTANNNHFTLPLLDNEAFVLSISSDLQQINWTTLINQVEMTHTSINDIVAIKNGQIFVTGGIGMDPNPYTQAVNQALLAVTIDVNNGNIMSDLTHGFQWSNCPIQTQHMINGVSAVYYEDSDDLWLMANVSYWHHPSITKISNISSPTPNIGSHYGIALGSTESSGFKLLKGQTDAELLLYGMIAWGGQQSNSEMFVTNIDKTTLSNPSSIYESQVWSVPSPDFGLHGGGVFSTSYASMLNPSFISTPHQYIFNQEIATPKLFTFAKTFDGAVIAPAVEGNKFSIEFMNNAKAYSCAMQQSSNTMTSTFAQHNVQSVSTNSFPEEYFLTEVEAFSSGTMACELKEDYVGYFKAENNSSITDRLASGISVASNNGVFNLSLDDQELTDVTVDIFTAAGSKVKNFVMTKSSEGIQVDLSHCAQGIYIMQLKTASDKYTRKIFLD